MAHFELWERATLNEFAREATRKLLENDAEIKRLQKIEAAAQNLVEQKGRHHTQQAYERLAELVAPNK